MERYLMDSCFKYQNGDCPNEQVSAARRSREVKEAEEPPFFPSGQAQEELDRICENCKERMFKIEKAERPVCHGGIGPASGVVGHPIEWEFCGYNELMRSRQRYNIIHWKSLTTLLGLKNREELRHAYGELVKEALRTKRLSREPIWTESVAVGSKEFVARAAEALRLRPKQRTIEAVEKLGSDRRIETWVIRENIRAYRRDFGAPKSPVSNKSAIFID